MAARTRTAPPPTPARNDTGVVPRWRAWTATAGAGLFGWAAGSFGLGNAIAVLVWTLLAVGVAVGVTHELCRQAHNHEFDDIERRQRETRALKGEPHG